MTDVESLPTEAQVERTASGWSIRLPLRREEVSLEKRTVIGERLVVRRARVPDVARVHSDFKREQLRVDERSRHEIEAAHPLDAARPHDTLAGSGMDQDPLG